MHVYTDECLDHDRCLVADCTVVGDGEDGDDLVTMAPVSEDDDVDSITIEITPDSSDVDISGSR